MIGELVPVKSVRGVLGILGLMHGGALLGLAVRGKTGEWLGRIGRPFRRVIGLGTGVGRSSNCFTRLLTCPLGFCSCTSFLNLTIILFLRIPPPYLVFLRSLIGVLGV